MKYAFAEIVYVLTGIGLDLPRFKEHVKLFEKNEDAKDILGLFYREILELHLVILRTFQKKSTFNRFPICSSRSNLYISQIQN